MDFLAQHSRFQAGRDISPAATPQEMLDGHAGVGGSGLYFLSVMFVLHPQIKPERTHL